MLALLVDDESHRYIERLKEVTAQHARLLTVEWYIARDGASCLKMLRDNAYCLVLMDGHLHGKDPEYRFGYRVVKKVRALGFAMPICMFSSDTEMNLRGLCAGANLIASKELLPCSTDAPLIQRRKKGEFAEILASCLGLAPA